MKQDSAIVVHQSKCSRDSVRGWVCWIGWVVGLFGFAVVGVAQAGGGSPQPRNERIDVILQRQLDLMREVQSVPLDLPVEQIECNAWTELHRHLEEVLRRSVSRPGAPERELDLSYSFIAAEGDLDREATEDGHTPALMAARYRWLIESGFLDDVMGLLRCTTAVAPSIDSLNVLDSPEWSFLRLFQALLVDRAVLMSMGRHEEAADRFAVILHVSDTMRWRGNWFTQVFGGNPTLNGIGLLREELLLGHLDAGARRAHLAALNRLPGPPPAAYWHRALLIEMELAVEWVLAELEDPITKRERAREAGRRLGDEHPELRDFIDELSRMSGEWMVDADTIRSVNDERVRVYRRFLAAPHADRAAAARIFDPNDLLVELDDRYLALTVHPHPSFRNLFGADRDQIMRDLTHLMLAVEVFRDTHGRLPERLDRLVPDFIGALPSDPFAADGRYRYRPAMNEAGGRGYALYSVGWDGIDNDGTPHPDDAADSRSTMALHHPAASGTDWVVSVKPHRFETAWLAFDRMPLEAMRVIRDEADGVGEERP